jgi:aspartate carbamoyltransferase catalytic subunit
MRESQLQHVSWDAFESLSLSEKAPLLNDRERTFHALIAQQFDRATLERLGDVATMVRRIAKTRGGMNWLQSMLSEKRAMMYFVQPSTRTFLSFYAACQILGIRPAEVRNTENSSEIKGETPEDTVRIFSSYFDMIIMRYPEGGFAERIAWLLSHSDRPVPVISAGSGKDQHPTQALLDVYTLQRSFEARGGIDGKTVAFVGDLRRGRTVRSLAWLLTQYEGVRQIFVAPKSLQIGEDVLETLDQAGTEYEVTEDFTHVIPQVDAIYMTRLQDEWDRVDGTESVDTSDYYLKAEHMKVLRPEAVILHPLPRRHEIDTAIDSDPRAMYWRQVRNGMWIRAALILRVFDRDAEIDRYYEDLTRSSD